MEMKKYAVFAKRVKNPSHAKYTIWHFLNDTDDIYEALHWRQAAIENDDYTDVTIVAPVNVEVQVSL